MRRALVLLVLLTACSAKASVATPAAASGTPGPSVTLPLTAFAEAETTAAQVAASRWATLGVDGVNVTADGTGVGDPDDAALAHLGQAHAAGRRAELLVGNFSSDLGDFDPAVAAALLQSPDHVVAVANRLASVVTSQHWDGVNVDLESLTAADAPGLVSFLQALSLSTTVSIDVQAETSAQEYAAAGYDLAGIAGTRARVVLMAYDQPSPG